MNCRIDLHFNAALDNVVSDHEVGEAVQTTVVPIGTEPPLPRYGFELPPKTVRHKLQVNNAHTESEIGPTDDLHTGNGDVEMNFFGGDDFNTNDADIGRTGSHVSEEGLAGTNAIDPRLLVRNYNASVKGGVLALEPE